MKRYEFCVLDKKIWLAICNALCNNGFMSRGESRMVFIYASLWLFCALTSGSALSEGSYVFSFILFLASTLSII